MILDSIPIFEYCSGLNSAGFAESDSFQYSYTAFGLKSTIFMIPVFKYCSGLNSAGFAESDTFQYSYTAFDLELTIFMSSGLNSAFLCFLYLKISYIYCLGHIPAFVCCSGQFSLIPAFVCCFGFNSVIFSTFELISTYFD